MSLSEGVDDDQQRPGDSQKNANKSLASQGAISFIGNVTERLTGFVFLLLVSRLVTPSAFGAFTLGLTIILLLRGVAGLSLHRAVDYFVPKQFGKVKRIRIIVLKALGLTVVSTVITALGVVVAASFLADTLNEPTLKSILPFLALSLPLWGALNVFMSFFRAIKKVQYLVYTRKIILPVIKLLASITLITLGWGIYGLVGGYVLAIGLSFAAAVLFLIVALGFFDDKSFISRQPDNQGSTGEFTFRAMLSYSLPLLFAGVIYTIVWQVDYFVIGYFLTSAEVGKYKVAYLLTANLVVVVGSLSQIYKPIVAERMGDPESIASLYQLTTRWVVLLTMPMVTVLLMAPQTYLEMLFTGEYAVAGAVISIMTIGYLINALGGPEAMMLEGLGHSRLSLLNAIVLIVVNLSLDVYLVSRLGILGVALGTTVALAARVFAGVLEIYLLYGIHPYGRWIGEVAAASFLSAVAGSILVIAIDSQFVTAIALPLIVSGAYLLGLNLTSAFTEDDREVAQAFDNRLGRRVLQHVVRT